jgi:hypothetical protein
MVARQFIAWNPGENGNRPVGDGMIGSDRRVMIRTTNQAWVRIRPSLRDGSFSKAFQALKCLATIIQSLRDEVRQPRTGRVASLDTSQAKNYLATFIQSFRDKIRTSRQR